jgi:LysM repeat protein
VVPFHALETPIGIEHQFIIHRILLGESLPLISTHYGTTVEAIQLVNSYIQIPLLVDFLVIIPVNQTDVSGLPAFEAYRVEKDTPVEELAQQLLVDPAVLKYYNDLKDGQVLTAGEWVLVPHTGTATPRPY